MEVTFLYNAPHKVHAEWARSVNAFFVKDRVKENGIQNFSRLFKSLDTLKKIPPGTEVLLCEGGSQIFSGALWKVFHPKKKLVLIVSDPKMYYLHKMNFIKKFFNILALRRFDLFIPTSPLMASLIPKGLKGERVIVYPFFERERFKGKGGNLKSHNIIFAARTCKEKGSDLLVDLFVDLKKEFEDTKLFFLGISSYIPGQGDLRKELEERRLKDVYFEGLVKDPELFMQNCSLYVSLARIEPAGVSILEAMYLGLVPVVSRGTGNSYIVKEIAEELVVADKEEARRLIKRLWTSPRLLKTYSQRGKKISKGYTKQGSVKLFGQAMGLAAK